MQRNPDSVGKCNSEESKRLEVGNHFIGLRFVQIAEGRHLTFAFRNDCSHNDVGGLWLMIAEVPFESGTRQRGCRMNAMTGCAIAREGLLSLSNRLCGFRLVRPGRAPDGEHPRNAGPTNNATPICLRFTTTPHPGETAAVANAYRLRQRVHWLQPVRRV